jgi:hypothetical protein
MIPQSGSPNWLAEHGLKELERLFRVIIDQPSASILIADNERRYGDAGMPVQVPASCWEFRGSSS